MTCGIQGAENTNYCSIPSDTSMVAKDNADHSGVDIFMADAQGDAEGAACMTIYADGAPMHLHLHLYRSCSSTLECYLLSQAALSYAKCCLLHQ